MGKYRNKPIMVEAMQFTDENKDRVFNWITGNHYPYYEKVNPVLRIQTLEGMMIAHFGDYIIRGLKGEYDLCKPDIFEQTYELVED